MGMNEAEARAQAAATPEEKKVWVDANACITCGACGGDVCPTGAITIDDVAHVDRDLCIGDMACVDKCPVAAFETGIEDKARSSGKAKL